MRHVNAVLVDTLSDIFEGKGMSVQRNTEKYNRTTRHSESEECQRQVESFLSQGGEIIEVPSTARMMESGRSIFGQPKLKPRILRADLCAK